MIEAPDGWITKAERRQLKNATKAAASAGGDNDGTDEEDDEDFLETVATREPITKEEFCNQGLLSAFATWMVYERKLTGEKTMMAGSIVEYVLERIRDRNYGLPNPLYVPLHNVRFAPRTRSRDRIKVEV